jgi:hypothetical protein
MIGILLLMGITKKNSIILVDYANSAGARGLGAMESMLEAGPTRLRPILMTTVATMMAAVPSSLGLGAGAETRGPMAIAVLGVGVKAPGGLSIVELWEALLVARSTAEPYTDARLPSDAGDSRGKRVRPRTTACADTIRARSSHIALRVQPVFDAKVRNSGHVLQVGGDQGGVDRKSVGRDRRVEIFDAFAPAFERCLDGSKVSADLVRPGHSFELGPDSEQPLLEPLSSLRSWQSLDAIDELGQHGLRDGNVVFRRAAQSFDDQRIALHPF